MNLWQGHKKISLKRSNMKEKKGKPGAIVCIIYKLVTTKGLEEFSAREIIELYKQYKKCSYIQKIIKCLKKHNDNKNLKTLEDENKLKAWLDKHTSHKEVRWFKKNDNGKYQFKEEIVREYRLNEVCESGNCAE